MTTEIKGASCAFIALFAVCNTGCGGRCERGGTVPEKPSSGPCGLSPSTRFPPDPKLSEVLKVHRDNASTEALTSAELQSECSTVWQDVVETAHCGGRVVKPFCEGACTSNVEIEKCQNGTQRELVMRRCREEAVSTFVTEYPLCKDFRLCKDHTLRLQCP